MVAARSCALKPGARRRTAPITPHSLPDGDPAVNEPYIRDRFNDAIERLSQQETLELDKLDDIARGKQRS